MEIHDKNIIPRGEVGDFVLLCSYKDKDEVLHGLALRKAREGSIRIDIGPVRVSAFSKITSSLSISDDVEERTIRLNPEIHGITVPEKAITYNFGDAPEVKQAISDLLQVCVRQTLHSYHGLCPIEVGDGKRRPAFVFASTEGRYTALTLTSVPIYASASVYVNYIQPSLTKPSYWRVTCFQSSIDKPDIIRTAKKDIDLASLRTIVLSCVLTFNSLNCETERVFDADGVCREVLDAVPCAYDMRL